MDQLSDQFAQLELNAVEKACTVCIGTVDDQIRKAQWFRTRNIAYRLTRIKLDRERLGQVYNIAFIPLDQRYNFNNSPNIAINSVPRKMLARVLYHSYINRVPFAQFGGRDIYFEDISLYMYGKVNVTGHDTIGAVCEHHRCPTCTSIKSHRKPQCWRCLRISKNSH